MNQPEREAFVAALLAGELSLDDPQVQARLREDPELEIMVERIRDVEAEVARATKDLAEIRIGDLVPDRLHDERVRAAVGQVVAERRRQRQHLWLAAAAALLVGLVAGWYFLIRTPAAPGDMFLGSDPRLEPRDEVTNYSPFRWDIPRPPGVRFVLSIYSVVNGRKGTLLYSTPPGNVTSPWQLPKTTSLPDEIYWEVEVIGGDLPEKPHAHAWRRR
jgi:hypothetical protein